MAGLRSSKTIGEEVVFLGGGLGQFVGRRLMADGHIYLHVARSRAGRTDKATGNHRSWKSRLVPIEIKLIARFATGQGHGMGCALRSAGEDLHSLGNADMHLGGESIVWKPVVGNHREA